MKTEDIKNEIVREVVSEEQIDKKLGEIAKLIDEEYKGKDLLLAVSYTHLTLPTSDLV